jgi:hypothetical protein
MDNIRQKIITFIQYSNAFTVGLVLVLFGAGVIFAASPEARQAVSEAIGQEVVTEQTGVDNTAILAADLSAFDPQMKIEAVSEDEKNYYVEYSFSTLGIQDNVWQPISRKLSMIIDKLSLQGGDLGLYVQKQLNEIAQNELVFLKKVQTAEIAKGKTEIAQTTEYTGLIGLVLDVKNAILPGYEPVVAPNDQLSAVNNPVSPVVPAEPGNPSNATTTKETTGGDHTRSVVPAEPLNNATSTDN